MALRKFQIDLRGQDPGPSRTSALSPMEEYIEHLERETVENKPNWPYTELQERRAYVTQLREQEQARGIFLGEVLGHMRNCITKYPGIDLFEISHGQFDYMLRRHEEDDWNAELDKPISVVEGALWVHCSVARDPQDPREQKAPARRGLSFA